MRYEYFSFSVVIMRFVGIGAFELLVFGYNKDTYEEVSLELSGPPIPLETATCMLALQCSLGPVSMRKIKLN